MKSPFLPVVAPLVALIASLARWWLQDSHNVYTAIEKRFYVPDPDFGWRISGAHPVWLGLEVCAVIAAVAIAVFVIRRRLRVIAWLLGAVTLVVPVVAFASGSRPAGARDTLPVDATQVVIDGIAGGLDAPAGRYEVVAHDGTSITAHLSAGGESFDARFTGDLRGFWDGDPRAMGAPMRADVGVAAASVDTGVRARSTHARTKYLNAETYPRIEVTLDRVVAAQAIDADRVAFRARGTLSLIGRRHAVAIEGTLVRPDEAARARLGLTGVILLVKATFSIAIKDTALAANASDFDGETIPISVSLVLKKS